MKRTLGMEKDTKSTNIRLPKIEGRNTASILPDDKEIAEIVDNSGCCREAPFDQQFQKLARPFEYLNKINAQDQESRLKRARHELDQNVSNHIWATDLAQEIQYIMLVSIKSEDKRFEIRDNIVIGSTNYIKEIFNQILDLYKRPYHSIEFDIEALFGLIIEETYRLERIVTKCNHDKVNFDDTRRILRKFREWILELRKPN